MKNFKFESYPEKDIPNLIKDFNTRIKTIEESFENGNNSILISELLNLEKGETAKDKLKLIGFEPKTLDSFQGVYIFYDPEIRDKNRKGKIVYVGISRKLIQRIRQHVNYSSPNTASLAYLMAKKEKTDELGWEIREDWKERCSEWVEIKENFDTIRIKHQNIIKSYHVTFSEFTDNFEMALFEIYAAMKWEVYWNSFRTH